MHSGIKGNEKEDEKAKEGVIKERKNKIPKSYELEGARLSLMMQKLASEYIMHMKRLNQ